MKNSFESPMIDKTNESDKVVERDPVLLSLWKKYGFMGEPPIKGSPVEERLYETCRKYLKHALGEISTPPIKKSYEKEIMGDSENYFAKKTDLIKSSSDPSRRELHNQIALMVVGRQRSGMDSVSAEAIADFACELVNGCKLSEMEVYK